ncbi:MAG TPA: penicillin-binding protein 2, partial [Patescibacteria group bacterium]|nr:penicillin-binding protein 2 [Patescibacteria group bacterium]
KIVDIPLYEIQSKIAKFATLYPHPIVIKENLNYDSAVMLNIKSISLPGVVFQTNYNREYLTVNNDGSVQPNTQNNSTAHILGYIGTITEEEFKNINTDNYLLDDKIGKTGIEYSYEDILRGTMGQKQVEVDALGKEKKTIAQDDQIPGKNIFLTIDSESQLKLERVLRELMAERKKERASAIAMDPNDGSIIAMVSLPSFNNNDFSGGISQKAYQALLENPNRPLFNRSVAGTYPSGSTIKPIIATAALNEGIITPNTTVYSTGGIRINQWFFPDWKAGGHGPTNLRSSLAWSVNTYYYYIGGGYEGFEGLGVQRLGAYMSEFQLGKKLGIDVPSEAAGFIPSKEWKEQTKNESWYIGDTYHMAIGQGDLLVTPLQVATWTSFFANKGTVYKPHFLFATAEEGYEPQYAETAVLNSNFVPENHVEQVRQGLRDTVVWGSAQRLNTLKVPAAGKTGTAQWHSDPERDPHSWFTAFAPFDDPEVVITVLVEEGGEGSDLALEVSKRFLMWYFEGIHARENDDTLPAENATITADTQAEYP